MRHLAMLLRGATSLTLGGNSRRPRQRFTPNALETFENRIVPTAALQGLSVTPTVLHMVNGHEEACRTFTNLSMTDTIKVGLASYSFAPQATKPTSPPTPQAFVDSETARLKPGESVTLCVRLADCPYGDQVDAFASQVDAFAGDGVIKKFNGYPNYDYSSAGPYAWADGTYFSCDSTTGKVKGNEGLGNGVDPPPPGHAGDTVQNDDSGTPGQPNKGWNKKN